MNMFSVSFQTNTLYNIFTVIPILQQSLKYCSTINEILIGSKLFILCALIINYSPFNIVLQNVISSLKNANIFSFPYSRGIINELC